MHLSFLPQCCLRATNMMKTISTVSTFILLWGCAFHSTPALYILQPLFHLDTQCFFHRDDVLCLSKTSFSELMTGRTHFMICDSEMLWIWQRGWTKCSLYHSKRCQVPWLGWRQDLSCSQDHYVVSAVTYLEPLGSFWNCKTWFHVMF